MQRDFDRFEKRAGKNLVKFKEAKCQIFQHRCSNPMQQHKLKKKM